MGTDRLPIKHLKTWGRWLVHTPWGRLAGITAWAGLLLFYRLGDLAFDPDERLIMVWATEVHEHAPGWTDLVRRIVQEGGYYRSDLYPGLNIYLTAVSFRVFGVSPWAARFPSALIALASVPVFYLVTRRLLNNPSAALLGTIALISSAPLLFLLRQCRYTSLTVLAGLWLLRAYLDILDRRRYGWLHVSGAMLLFFYTSFYLFLPMALSLALHSVCCTRGRLRRNLILAFAAGGALTVVLAPEIRLSLSRIADVLTALWSQNHISILYKMSVCVGELNLVGLPFILMPAYVYARRAEGERLRATWIALGLWGVFMLLTSALGPLLLHDGLGRLLDRLWPALSPWVFNRLVDYRSWLLLTLLIGLALIVRRLRPSSDRQYLSIPVVLIAGMVAIYCVFPIFRMPWTRYLANPLIAAYMLVGLLAAGIMARKPLLAISLLVLHSGSNILSVVPFTPGHYPYWQWKLPHWLYRLATGDPVNEIILNFIRIPPL